MRKEPLFSRYGYYGFLLDSNALLHREAVVAARHVLGEFLRARSLQAEVRVLDLACGGLPITLSEAMGAFPGQTFDYTGVDINTDQVELASRFRFANNVTASLPIEGNAWEPSLLDVSAGFDLVYSGMNLHHGTPEEIHFLAMELRKIMRRPGLFISHDVYRPDDTLYRRRPDRNPENPAESWQLVDSRRLSRYRAGVCGIAEDGERAEPSWRRDYLQRMHETLLARGGEPDGAQSTVAHMRERDYPISLAEFRAVFTEQGFEVSNRRYDAPGEPMAPYIGFCAAILREWGPASDI